MTDYKYLLFDLDGALTLSHYGIYSCARYALEKLGKRPPTDQQLGRIVGPPLFSWFHEIYGLEEQDAEKAVELYREKYKAGGMYENKPQPYALELLKNVKRAGYQTALATAKPKPFADAIAEKFGFLPYFDIAAVATFDKGSDKSFVVGEMLKRFGAKAEECLMIGDRADDVLGARAHGVDTAAVRCGYAEKGELEQARAKYIFNDLKELNDFLV